jgi:hypothetical protein
MASLNEDKKADLRKHHFEFGYQENGLNKISDYQEKITKKEVPNDVREEARVTKDRARSSVKKPIFGNFFNRYLE